VGGKREQGAIRKVPTPPEIDSSSVAMPGDELSRLKVDSGEVIVVTGCLEKGGPNCQKGEIKSPHIPESGRRIEYIFRTHKSFIGIPPSIKGDDDFGDGIFNDLPYFRRQNVEKSMVREKGNDKNVNKQDAMSERQVVDDMFSGV
jgi:hypothetical protein